MAYNDDVGAIPTLINQKIKHMIFNDDSRNFASPIDPSEVEGSVNERDWGGMFIAAICILATLYFGGHMLFWFIQGCPVTTNAAGDIAYQCSDVK